MACIDVLFQHGKGCRCKLFLRVSKFGKYRHIGFFLDGGKKGRGVFPKTEHTGIKYIPLFCVKCKILLANIQQNVEYTAGNSGISAVLGFQQVAERAKIAVLRQKLENAVRKVFVDIKVVRKAAVCRKPGSTAPAGKVVGENGERLQVSVFQQILMPRESVW